MSLIYWALIFSRPKTVKISLYKGDEISSKFITYSTIFLINFQLDFVFLCVFATFFQLVIAYQFVFFLFLSGSQAVEARKLVTVLIEKMTSIGYVIGTGVDFSRSPNSKALLLFRKTYPFHSKVFCLSMNSTDILRLINAPKDVIEVSRQFYVFEFNTFLASIPILYPLKAPENLQFSGVFKGCKMRH